MDILQVLDLELEANHLNTHPDNIHLEPVVRLLDTQQALDLELEVKHHNIHQGNIHLERVVKLLDTLQVLEANLLNTQPDNIPQEQGQLLEDSLLNIQ